MSDLVSDAYRSQWADPAIERRIADGIRTWRTARAEIRVVDATGAPVPGAVVSATQTRHQFLFGANAFMLNAYGEPERDRRYEEAFLGLFNAATVAMYWRGLEPEQGAPRYAADSTPVWRRPPTDPAIAWCRRHRLNINGHTLVWDHPEHQLPAWLPTDPAERARLQDRRIRELGARYGSVVQRWDVVNERLHSFRRPPRNPEAGMPEDFDTAAFRSAQAAMPPEATLMINDYFESWNPHFTGYRELVEHLREHGARIDAAGLQCHSFTTGSMLQICRDATRLRPAEVFAALDLHRDLGVPLHVSEITLPQPGEDAAGEAAQAEVVRNLYRLWFSHPSVNAITWWNLPDGGAVAGEDRVLSGLIDRQHRPKAAYRALDRLINHEWRTRCDGLRSDADGCVRFRGFKGAYRLGVDAGGRQAEAEAVLGGDATITVRLA